MDILGILNDYINKNDHQLADEFIELLNKGKSFEEIANQYEITPSKVKEIIERTTNDARLSKINDDTNTFRLENVTSHSGDENTIIRDEEEYNELKVSMEGIIDMLNNGVEIEAVASRFNLTSKELNKLIHQSGYKYYGFMKYWTIMTPEELCEYLVSELNEYTTLYDLSGRYVKNNKDRVAFVSKIEYYFKVYNYKYDNIQKRWTKSQLDIETLVHKINNGTNMRDLAALFKTTTMEIRQALRRQNYRYDLVFNIWTQKKRSELIDDLAKELSLGDTTIDKLKERGINIDMLAGYEYNKLLTSSNIKNKIQENANPKIYSNEDLHSMESVQNSTSLKELSTNNNSVVIEKLQEELVVSDKKTSHQIIKDTNIEEVFNNEEIAYLKEMVSQWKDKKRIESGSNNESIEIPVFLNPKLFYLLNKSAEAEKNTFSEIINKALVNYFK